MVVIAVVFGVLSGLLHIQFWLLEAVWWRQERIWKRFGIKSQDQADGLAFNMINQGYYNLFLGIGAVVGAILLAVEVPGRTTLLGYCCLFMVGAGLVLFVSRRSMARAALIQAVPPLITLMALIWV
jgi:putative membrane protein